MDVLTWFTYIPSASPLLVLHNNTRLSFETWISPLLNLNVEAVHVNKSNYTITFTGIQSTWKSHHTIPKYLYNLKIKNKNWRFFWVKDKQHTSGRDLSFSMDFKLAYVISKNPLVPISVSPQVELRRGCKLRSFIFSYFNFAISPLNALIFPQPRSFIHLLTRFISCVERQFLLLNARLSKI